MNKANYFFNFKLMGENSPLKPNLQNSNLLFTADTRTSYPSRFRVLSFFSSFTVVLTFPMAPNGPIKLLLLFFQILASVLFVHTVTR